MSYRIIASALLGLATVSTVSAVYAQTESSTAPTQDFATVKARHLARLEQEIACVQAATSFDTLRACRPPPPDGGHRGPPPPR